MLEGDSILPEYSILYFCRNNGQEIGYILFSFLEDMLRDAGAAVGQSESESLASYLDPDSIQCLALTLPYDPILEESFNKAVLRLPVARILPFLQECEPGAKRFLQDTWPNIETQVCEYSNPDIVYKYQPNIGDWYEQWFKANTINMAGAEDFNDPLDCPYTGELGERIRAAGLSCFSEDPVNVLMFSHYANEHRGYAIGFDPNGFSGLKNLYDHDARPSMRKVFYYDELPKLDQKNDDGKFKNIAIAATTKHEVWSYEREWRLFPVKASDQLLPPAVYSFSQGAIKEVIFGCRMSDHDKEAIYRASRDLGILYYCATTIEENFGLELTPIQFNEKRLVWEPKPEESALEL